jgi:hypothetical protein
MLRACRGIAAFAALFLVLAAGFMLWPQNSERSIRKLLGKCAASIENRSIEGALSGVSFAYRDEFGLSYLVLKRLFEKAFARMSELDVQYAVTDVRVLKDSATVGLEVAVSAFVEGQTQYVLGSPHNREQMILKLAREELGWRVVSSSGMPGRELEDLLRYEALMP